MYLWYIINDVSGFDIGDNYVFFHGLFLWLIRAFVTTASHLLIVVTYIRGFELQKEIELDFADDDKRVDALYRILTD